MEFLIKDVFYNLLSETAAENSYFVRFPNNAAKGLTNSQISGRQFILNNGWKPMFVFTGFEGFLFLELEHNEDGRATWILDRELRFLANDLTKLTGAQSRALSRAGELLLSADRDSRFWKDFSELNDSVRNDMIKLAMNAGAATQRRTAATRRPVAVCFSGHPRAFLRYSDQWRTFFGGINDEFELRIFYHAWAETGFVKLENGSFKEGTYETAAFTAIDELNRALNPTSFCVETGSSRVNLAAEKFPGVYLNERQAAKRHILSQIYSVEQADRLRQDYDERHAPSTAVMRMRFDLVPADSTQGRKVCDEMRYVADNADTRIIFGTSPNFHRHPGGGGGCQACDRAFRAAGMPSGFSMPRHHHGNDLCDLYALGSPAAMALYASLFTNARTVWAEIEAQSKSPGELGLLPCSDDDNPNDMRVLLDGDQTENGLHCFYPEKLLRFHLKDIAVVNGASEFHICRR